ncbi:MAG: dihydrodipicolinate synthase family protein [Gemmatimonadota bacterium]
MAEKLARGIWPALCTAFDDTGKEIDAGRVRGLVRALLDTGIDGFFVTGSTGEGAFLTVPERRQMASVVTDEVAGAVPLMLQVGATTTENAVALARHAATCKNLDAVASVAPVDRPNDLEAAVRHYAAIGAATDLPFYVYWLAATADKRVTADQFLDAMKAVPNFAGVKFTDTNLYLFQQLIAVSGGRVNAISGPDEMCVAAMVMGADAAIGTTYNIMPRLFLGMRRAFDQGDIREAMGAQVKANRVISFLLSIGALAGVKAMLAWRGLPVGPPRATAPLAPETAQRLRVFLDGLDYDVT